MSLSHNLYDKEGSTQLEVETAFAKRNVATQMLANIFTIAAPIRTLSNG